MYTELTAGGQTYKLRLTTQGTVQLEKTLGYNPLQIFMGIDEDVLPKFSDMMAVLHQALQAYQHGITKEDAFEIFDAFRADGNTLWDLIPILLDVFIDAGFLPKDAAETENPKN